MIGTKTLFLCIIGIIICLVFFDNYELKFFTGNLVYFVDLHGDARGTLSFGLVERKANIFRIVRNPSDVSRIAIDLKPYTMFSFHNLEKRLTQINKVIPYENIRNALEKAGSKSILEALRNLDNAPNFVTIVEKLKNLLGSENVHLAFENSPQIFMETVIRLENFSDFETFIGDLISTFGQETIGKLFQKSGSRSVHRPGSHTHEYIPEFIYILETMKEGLEFDGVISLFGKENTANVLIKNPYVLVFRIEEIEEMRITIEKLMEILDEETVKSAFVNNDLIEFCLSISEFHENPELLDLIIPMANDLGLKIEDLQKAYKQKPNSFARCIGGHRGYTGLLDNYRHIFKNTITRLKEKVGEDAFRKGFIKYPADLIASIVDMSFGNIEEKFSNLDRLIEVLGLDLVQEVPIQVISYASGTGGIKADRVIEIIPRLREFFGIEPVNQAFQKIGFNSLMSMKNIEEFFKYVADLTNIFDLQTVTALLINDPSMLENWAREGIPQRIQSIIGIFGTEWIRGRFIKSEYLYIGDMYIDNLQIFGDMVQFLGEERVKKVLEKYRDLIDKCFSEIFTNLSNFIELVEIVGIEDWVRNIFREDLEMFTNFLLPSLRLIDSYRGDKGKLEIAIRLLQEGFQPTEVLLNPIIEAPERIDEILADYKRIADELQIRYPQRGNLIEEDIFNNTLVPRGERRSLLGFRF